MIDHDDVVWPKKLVKRAPVRKTRLCKTTMASKLEKASSRRKPAADALSAVSQNILEGDVVAAKENKNQKKEGITSRSSNLLTKRVIHAADSLKEAKFAKTEAISSTQQSKITTRASRSIVPKDEKDVQTPPFTSANKTISSSLVIPTRSKDSKITLVESIDDDAIFESFIKNIRPEAKPTTIELFSPQTAVKPKEAFVVPRVRKRITLPAPKLRGVSKAKSSKRRLQIDDNDSFEFAADKIIFAPMNAERRRPKRAAAIKARTFLTSDDVDFELNELEDDFEVDDDEE
jgi:hypothetical protein